MFYNDLIPLYEQRKRNPRNIYRDYEWPDNLLVDLHLSVNKAGKASLWREDEACIEPSPQVLPRIEYILQATLTEREAEIIHLRYEKKQQYGEIAKTFGISSSRIPQILHKAHRKLRHPIRWTFLLHGYTGAVLDARRDGYNEGYKDARRELTPPPIMMSELVMDFYELRVPSLYVPRKRVETVFEFLSLDRETILSTPGFTRHKLDYIVLCLERFGYDCTHLKRHANEGKTPSKTIATAECSRPIEELYLSARSFNQLYRYGCRTVKDILDMTRHEFCTQIRYFGSISQAEVIDKLKELGFCCAHLEPSPGQSSTE